MIGSVMSSEKGKGTYIVQNFVLFRLTNAHYREAKLRIGKKSVFEVIASSVDILN